MRDFLAGLRPLVADYSQAIHMASVCAIGAEPWRQGFTSYASFALKEGEELPQQLVRLDSLAARRPPAAPCICWGKAQAQGFSCTSLPTPILLYALMLLSEKCIAITVAPTANQYWLRALTCVLDFVARPLRKVDT